MVFAGSDLSLLEELKQQFSTDYYRIQTSRDLVGVQAAIAFKNLYAVLIGMMKGRLETNDQTPSAANSVAAIYTQSLLEIAYIVDHLGGDQQSVFDLPGIGDLFVTSQSGRNAQYGYLLGTGLSLEEARNKFDQHAAMEGLDLAHRLNEPLISLLTRQDVDEMRLPLLRFILTALRENPRLAFPWENLGKG